MPCACLQPRDWTEPCKLASAVVARRQHASDPQSSVAVVRPGGVHTAIVRRSTVNCTSRALALVLGDATRQAGRTGDSRDETRPNVLKHRTHAHAQHAHIWKDSAVDPHTRCARRTVHPCAVPQRGRLGRQRCVSRKCPHAASATACAACAARRAQKHLPVGARAEPVTRVLARRGERVHHAGGQGGREGSEALVWGRADVRWTMSGPFSSYSSFVIHI